MLRTDDAAVRAEVAEIVRWEPPDTVNSQPLPQKVSRILRRYLALAEALVFAALKGEDKDITACLDSLCTIQCGETTLLQRGSSEYKALEQCRCTRPEVLPRVLPL